MHKSFLKKSIRITGAAVLLCAAFVSVAFAAESVSYCYLDLDESGRVIASWGEEWDRGDYRLRVFYNGKPLGAALHTTGAKKDITYLVAQNGPGFYSCRAYLRTDGYEAGISSGYLVIDSSAYKTAKQIVKGSDAFPVYKGPGEKEEEAPAQISLLVIEGAVEAGSVRPVTVRPGKGMTLNGVSYSVPYEQWSAGGHVLITLTMKEDGSLPSGKGFTFTCNNAGVLHTARDTETGIHTVVLSYTPVMRLAAPTEFSVDEEYILHWKASPKAERYMLRFYRNGELEKVIYQSRTKIDLSEYAFREWTDVSITALGPKDVTAIRSSSPATLEFSF